MMANLLLMEGNTAERRARAASLGVRSSSEIYTHAIRAHYPDVMLDVVYAADEDWMLPGGKVLSDFDGLVITGSALHAYDKSFAVTNQIALVAAAGAVGLPMFGSCWGLQIAVMAAGGMVEYNQQGREVGVARKIIVNEAGADHAMFAGKSRVYDALCIHYDEVTRMPDGATLLASNMHSPAQAAVVRVGKSDVWAVQYHPEFDLDHMAKLYTLYADDMIGQGFFADQAALDAHVALMIGLAANHADVGLAWQLGIDADIIDDRRRRTEIINWIEHCVLRAA